MKVSGDLGKIKNKSVGAWRLTPSPLKCWAIQLIVRVRIRERWEQFNPGSRRRSAYQVFADVECGHESST